MVSCKQRGSTLIEVLIAMVLLSLLIVGLNAGVVSLINSNLQSKDLTSATTVGNQLFEELRRGDYTTITADIDTVRGRFVRDWKINSLSDVTQTAIDLTVRWPKESQKRHIQLSTIIASP